MILAVHSKGTVVSPEKNNDLNHGTKLWEFSTVVALDIPVAVGTASMTSQDADAGHDRPRREDGGVPPRLQPPVAGAHVGQESSSHLLHRDQLISHERNRKMHSGEECNQDAATPNV
ncbi:hypothetical protein CTI12_AA069600 [Artemisia annua]|uniref:Uncharacterized protein n=1 Tax=Artemisia annua TaxID=35608 RepID=A0A2U1P2N6_ARTAN|nr:hypothetical protein CTI12_AA069600 [Artemisia annua]